jgi:TonB-dependent SusC/RagA subfamily outer membrane receptor
MSRYLVALAAGLLILATACTSNRSTAYQGQTIDNGYAKVKERNTTGAVTQIDNPMITRTLADHLRSVAGVNVNGEGANAQVRIRGGMTSFSGPGEPLFIIDGQSFTGFAQVYSAVNVVDIKSITVLKDESQTAIYGTRGMNGVIVIKTKVGR